MRSSPTLSIVIPVYNEEAVLEQLFARLYPALDALRTSYEVIFVNDGSRDQSVPMLRAQFERRPKETRCVLLLTNFGQHAAILAGLEQARGEYIVTLDADLQNPPEEVGKILGKLQEGYDYVGSYRAQRQDVLWRRLASKVINGIREKITPIHMADHGCMLRGYARPVIDAILSTRESVTFIPALASLYSAKPIEIQVAHEERAAGVSKYSLKSLIRLNFDLMTGFSLVPLQIFSAAGIATAVISGILFVVLAVRRIVLGPEAEGLFTLFALVFFLLGIILFGIGLLGEYVGRIYVQVRERPRYIIASVLQDSGNPAVTLDSASSDR